MKALACNGINTLETDVIAGFRGAGLAMDELPVGDLTEKKIEEGEYLFVFTTGFVPEVSDLCQKLLMPYIVYIVEWPVIELYHPSVKNACNFIFCFDEAVVRELNHVNPGRFYHLPSGADTERLKMACDGLTPEKQGSYQTDVSFVGSLYTEDCLYNELKGVSDFTKGYMDALIEAQLKVYGYNLLEDALNRSLVDELKKCLPYRELPDGAVGTDQAVMASVYVGNKVTEQERLRLLKKVSAAFDTDLYTSSDASGLPDIHVKGPVPETDEMAKIYCGSKINLSLTPKSVRTGVSQQIFDIMGAGGFVLTNFQPEIPELFYIGEHLETFTSETELMEKIQYYLEHEEERKQIALAGQQIVREVHTYEMRAAAMFNTVFSDVE